MVGRVNAGLEGLDSKLDLVASQPARRPDSLNRDAAAMTSLGVRLGQSPIALGAGIGTVADVQAIITVTLLVFTAWTAVPAIGALGLGLWLRKEVGPAEAGPEMRLAPKGQSGRSTVLAGSLTLVTWIAMSSPSLKPDISQDTT